jgi:CheY-like chemotaxis protein
MQTIEQILGSRRLLAIDDEPLDADLIARIARKCGYDSRAIVETTGLADIVSKWKPDIISLDLRMPRASGSAVIALLKTVGFRGELIIASGLGRSFLDAARFEAEKGGLNVAGAFRKPLDLQALRELLIELAARHTASAAE